MADLFNLDTLGVADDNSTLSTGDLRRKYNFGSRVSELAIAQDPFFRLVSKLSKKPCDDPQFKFTERRPSFHKRYGYVYGAGNSGTPAKHGDISASTTKLIVAGDYKSAGNEGSVYGQTAIEIGSAGTKPAFFMAGQLIKVPTHGTLGSASSDGYAVFRVDSVEDSATTNMKLLTGAMVKTPTNLKLTFKFDDDKGKGADSQESLAPKRTYVIGTAHQQGSGYPETWKDQPFKTGFGNTQIWKTACAMDNTSRATVLKYDSSEWARVWKEKLIEHKYDIEQSLLFNGTAATASDGAWYTDGVVNYISGFGNQFSLATATKTQDDFLDDMSAFLDPRYNNANATVFFCSTAVYNWLHKLSGYFSNNLGIIGKGSQTPATDGTSLGRSDMSISGRKKAFGVDITTITTPYGDMNVARNIHLDGTNIGLLGVNMRYCAYRPLVGNGQNRDTSVYVGVQTLENSGVDRRVDLIQTEAGLEIHMPEAHAIWTV